MDRKESLYKYLVEQGEDIKLSDIKESDYDKKSFETPNAAYEVLTDDEADEAFLNSQECLIDDIGLDAFCDKDYVINNYILGTESMKQYMEEDYESYLNDIKNESDSYFDSRYMQEITEFLCKNNILDIDYDDILEYLSDKETSLQDFISENDDISLLRKIESYSNIKRYFDEFEDNEDEYKEKWIENAIDGYENEAEWVIFNFGKDAIAGFVEHGLLEYDMEGICNYIEQFDGRGPTLVSYDGEERESSDGYYIYRTN